MSTKKKAGFDSGEPVRVSSGGARPLVVRLGELESELRLISARVDNSVVVDDKIRLEKDLVGLRNKLEDFSARVKGDMEVGSDRLKSEIAMVGKRVEDEIQGLARNFREDFASRGGNVDERLKKLEEEILDVVKNFNGEIKDLETGIERDVKSRFGEVDSALGRLKDEMEILEKKIVGEIKELDKRVLGNSNVELNKRVVRLEKEIGDKVNVEDRVSLVRELERVKEALNTGLVKVDGDISSRSRRVMGEVEELKKRLDGEIAGVSGDFARLIKEGNKDLFLSMKNLEKDVQDVASGLRRDSEAEIKGVSKEIGKVKADLASGMMSVGRDIKDIIVKVKKENAIEIGALNKDIEKTRVDLIKDVDKRLDEFSRGVRRDILSLSKEVEANSLLEVNKRVKVLEKDRDDFVRVRDWDKKDGAYQKAMLDLEDFSRRTRDEVKFDVKKIEDGLKEAREHVDRENRLIHKKIEQNSIVELNRRVSVLEKELASIMRSIDKEDLDVGVMKRAFDERLFEVEKGLERVNGRVDEEEVKDKSIGGEWKLEAADIDKRVKVVDARINEFEGRVDLELEKIYDRLGESLELMMFWEKKLARVSDVGVSENKAGIKKRANQIGVIRERKKVLEKLRSKHAGGRTKRKGK